MCLFYVLEETAGKKTLDVSDKISQKNEEYEPG